MQPFVTTPPDGSGLPPIKDHVSLWNTVEKRLGPAGRQRVAGGVPPGLAERGGL